MRIAELAEYESQVDSLRSFNESLKAQNTEFGKAAEELKRIQSTKWWRLRQAILALLSRDAE